MSRGLLTFDSRAEMVQQVGSLPGPGGYRMSRREEQATGDVSTGLMDAVPEDADFDELDLGTDDLDPDEGQVPEPPESGTGDDDIPDEYFGTRLVDIEDPAVRKQTYETLRQADKVVNRRMQEIAELQKQAEEEARKQVPTPANVDEEPSLDDISDEDLLAQNGYDPNLLQYSEEVGKPIVAMLRRQLALEQRLEGLSQASEAERWEQKFFGDLKDLESEYGKLPYDRQTIEAFALERNIFDPHALYWSIAGPIHREAAQSRTTDTTRRETKRQVSGTRRRAAAPGSTQTKKPTTLQEAFEQAKVKTNTPAGYDPFAYEE